MGNQNNHTAMEGSPQNSHPQDQNNHTQPPNLPPGRNLPTELRLQIWDEFLKSERSGTHPRIHALKLNPRTNQFHSNQPISPLLHISHETRAFYLAHSHTSPGFSNYINFPLDTLYFLQDPNLKEQLTTYLTRTPGHQEIEQLAMSYNSSPREIDIQQTFCRVTSLRRFVTVFDDKRSRADAWADHDISFSCTSKERDTYEARRGGLYDAREFYNFVDMEEYLKKHGNSLKNHYGYIIDTNQNP
ncbi:hypothetical protein HYFRA_00006053 [Hymenoscyphus fraxineus]|uniref:2EXR domain-containing protein n=1 Tax=Hymenoscyphus fraxineus TaxID=746836 RepID=A0A9N9PPA7_9HELO|nr:hypothetical protein HYFRA_00006053 [Hymenoscyphus fraxineus]